ncbi:hypothetical protein ACJ41O_012832 [Fusarium nematophilum]
MSTSSIHSHLDPEEQYKQEAREAFNADSLEISGTQDKHDLLRSIQSFSFHFIKSASNREAVDCGAAQKGLDALWHMFIEVAKCLDKDDPFQDKLVGLLLWTKELDSANKSLHSFQSSAADWESYGFADSLQSAWERVPLAGAVSQQCSLATFSAKAFALGVCQDSIGLTALWCLREALETDDKATAVQLPAAVVWIDHCRHKILSLSVNNQTDDESSKAKLLESGLLAKKGGVDRPSFSMERWLFWRQRLRELSHSENQEVAKEAKRGFMCMINCGRDLDYDVPGESRFAERLQKAMGEALAKSGKESVSGEEIDIDVDWVE